MSNWCNKAHLSFIVYELSMDVFNVVNYLVMWNVCGCEPNITGFLSLQPLQFGKVADVL